MSDPPPAFSQPWTIEEREESFVIRDAAGNDLMNVYFNDRARNRPGWVSKDEARRMVRAALRLPELLKLERQMKSGGNFDQSDET